MLESAPKILGLEAYDLLVDEYVSDGGEKLLDKVGIDYDLISGIDYDLGKGVFSPFVIQPDDASLYPTKYLRPVAYAVLEELRENFVFGDTIEVCKEFQGKGIGTAMELALSDTFRDLGYKFFGAYHGRPAIARFFFRKGSLFA